MKDNVIFLKPEKVYHIYNRANGSEKLFLSEQDYLTFLQKYSRHIEPIADTYAYCLIPNHFHYMIKLKSESELIEYFQLLDPTFKVENLEGWTKRINQQFSNFFNAYSKYFNLKHERKGSLFIPRFKRKEIDTEDYFANLIAYIHTNPVHHGLTKSIEDWTYTSYHAYASSRPSRIKTDIGYSFFGGKEHFIEFHETSFSTFEVGNLEG